MLAKKKKNLARSRATAAAVNENKIKMKASRMNSGFI
jgi:hypothetical protein